MSQPNVPQVQGQQNQAPNLAQIIAKLGPQSKLVEQSVVDPSLAGGIKPSFATLTFKGKTWGVRHRGVTHQLLVRDPNTNQILGAVPTVDVVILKSAAAISKSFYIEKYKEGDFKQPDCWSTNGQVPDPAAPKRQNPTCRGCKWDAFGSRTMDDGRKGKACSDSKRLAVVPAADLRNEIYGGPMLLKLPPSGFAGLSELEANLLQAGFRYFALVIRLSFDHAVAYPKILFTPIATLNDDQMGGVIELQKNEQIDRILSEELAEVTGDPAQPVETKPMPVDTGTPPPTAQTPPPVDTGTPPPPHATATVLPFTTTTVPQEQPSKVPDAPVVQQAKPEPAQPAETPEQMIARLQAALAEATAAPKKTRKRTTPVTPAGAAAVSVVPAQQEVQPLAAHPNAIVPDGDDNEEEGDVPADLGSRVDALLSQ